MDFAERERLLRRIITGKLYTIVVHGSDYFHVAFRDPSLELLTEADFVYKVAFDSVKHELVSFEESVESLRNDNIWTDKHEKDLDALKKQIEAWQEDLVTRDFDISRQTKIKLNIANFTKQIEALYKIKNSMWGSTAEYHADATRKRFIIRSIIDVKTPDLIKNPEFIDRAVVCYYEQNRVEDGDIRELARTNPWRLFWTASKETGTPLFSRPTTETTAYQYALLNWTVIYDWAYQSDKRPMEDVINDDLRFDAWYKIENDRIDRENNKKALDNKIGNVKGDEVYIVTDAEGAKEVYKLNDKQASDKIKHRQKYIEDKGIVPEAELPDVKRDLQMKQNQMIMAAGKR